MAAEPLRVLDGRQRERRPRTKRRFGSFWRRFGRLTLFAAFLAFAAALVPREPSFEVSTLREGYPAKRDVVAPIQFHVLKNRDRLREEQTAATRAIAPIYSVDPSVAPRAKALLDSLRGSDLAAATPSTRAHARLRSLGLSPEAIRALNAPDGPRIVILAQQLVEKALDAGFLGGIESARHGTDSPEIAVDRDGLRVRVPWAALADPGLLKEQVWDEGQRTFPSRPEATQALQELVQVVVRPNLRYEASITERVRAEARATVNEYDGAIRKNDTIIRAGEIATADHVRALQSLRAWARRTRSAGGLGEDTAPLLGRVGLIAVLILGFLGYVKREHRSTYQETGHLLLLGLMTALVMGVGWLVVNLFRGYEMLIPITVLSLTAALLFGHAVAFGATLVASLVTGIVFGLGLPFLAGSAIAGIAAIATATGVRRRRDFYRPMLVVAIAYAVAITAMGLVDGARPDVLLRRALWGVGAGFASVLVATLLLPILESLFSVTTDVTLLELTDLNRPILRQLMIEAPGTYHHSMVVGSLAESAATAIGANPLLARAGAYYHDVGKMEKAEYYVENQSSARSRHEKLKPHMSALIIESHIREGVEIATRERLPGVIADAIRQHHGTTLMSFFYHKALQKDPHAVEADFRYPGPKPRTKEVAILMLADAVEAAARSLADPTPNRIRGVVTRILDARVKDGQLDECPITFEELAKIRERFIPILAALFHARVDYPAAPAAAPAAPAPATPHRVARGETGRPPVDHS